MLRINIAHLKTGVHHVSLEPEPADLELAPERFADIQVEAELDHEVGRISVSLQAQAVAKLVCDRTLQPFDQRIKGSYFLLFASPALLEDSSRGAFEDEYEDVRVLMPSDQSIDVTDAVRDTLLLAIPARCVAPGAEDLEIPTEFGRPTGEEDEIDPRWEALRALRSGDN